jgi:hypothetical protein
MKILFDQVGRSYKYPLSRKDIQVLKMHVEDHLLQKIKKIRFGCNTRTTQEGRIVKKGSIYEIRINFCLSDSNRSMVLSDNKKYLREIQKFGGVVNSKERCIEWDVESAKLYAFYVLLHEIGHIYYCEDMMGGKIADKTSAKEEKFCDNYSMEIVKKIKTSL